MAKHAVAQCVFDFFLRQTSEDEANGLPQLPVRIMPLVALFFGIIRFGPRGAYVDSTRHRSASVCQRRTQLQPRAG